MHLNNPLLGNELGTTRVSLGNCNKIGSTKGRVLVRPRLGCAHPYWGLINLCSNKSSEIKRCAPMTNAQEKRVKRIAEHKGFRLDKAGHGKGHGRFYIINMAEGGRMRSGVLDHEYSFSLEEAEAWLDTHVK